MKIELLKKNHYGMKSNPDYNETEPSGAENPVYIWNYDEIAYTSIVGLKVNDMEVEVLGGSGIVLEAGPGPTSVTVTLICQELSVTVINEPEEQ